MAMVLPVMFFVFLGIFWAGRMYNIYATVNQAARMGVRVAAQSTCVTCTDTSGTDAQVVTAVTNSLQADGLNINSIATPTFATPTGCSSPSATCTQPSNLWVCRNVLLTPTTITPAVCGVTVQFKYQMDLPQITLPWTTGQGILPSPLIAGHAQTAVEQ